MKAEQVQQVQDQIKKKVNQDQLTKLNSIVCAACKDKISNLTAKLKPLDFLLFKRTSRKFVKLLCKDCLNKLK